MTEKKIRIIGAAAVLACWLALTVAAWVLPPKDISEAERRPLDQFPTLSADTVFGGSFMSRLQP